MEKVKCFPTLRSGSHPSVGIIQASNLLSINNDCKMEIFRYLGYRDLINIAETSKQLHAAACDAFKRKFGNGKLTICSAYMDPWSRPWIDAYEDKAPDLRPDTRLVILKILRNFGHVVSHIFLKYHEYFKNLFGYHIENHIAEYCSKTLTNLTLLARPKMLFDDKTVQFINLKRIEMFESRSLTLGAVPFRECFPNLHSLTWYTGSQDGLPLDLGVIIGLPSVKNLHIYMGSCSTGQCRCEAILQLFRLNPQLTKLEFTHHSDKCDIEILSRVPDYLPSLEVLTSDGYSCLVTDKIIQFENVVEFTMYFYSNCKIIPFTFPKLKSFCVTYNTKETQSIAWDFIARHEHLKKLHVYYGRDPSSLTEMISIFSNRIEDLTITSCVVLPSEVVLRFLTEIRSLKKLLLVVRSYNSPCFNDLVQARISKRKKLKNLFYVELRP